MRLLLAEDDDALRCALGMALERRGFSIDACRDGLSAFEKLRARVVQAAILDLGLPGLDGLAIVHKIRQTDRDVPILVLTSRSETGDRVQSLNAGADDFLSKPFDIDELEARMRALLRRSIRSNSDSLSYGALRLDKGSGCVFLRDQLLGVTPRERAFLTALLDNPGTMVPKDRLSRAVFGTADMPSEDAIAVVACRVRKKLAGTDLKVVSMRGAGYALAGKAPHNG